MDPPVLVHTACLCRPDHSGGGAKNEKPTGESRSQRTRGKGTRHGGPKPADHPAGCGLRDDKACQDLGGDGRGGRVSGLDL